VGCFFRRPWVLWVGVAVGGWGTVLALYFWILPAVAVQVANIAPIAWEERLGVTAQNAIVGASPVFEDARARRVVTELVERLNEGSPGHLYTFQVTIVENSAVNAVAALGGYIVIFPGLLEKMHAPEELAGVLAHGLMHLACVRGSFRILSREVIVRLGFASAIWEISDEDQPTGALVRKTRFVPEIRGIVW
jgi:predicted Zn-dependent protease